MNSEDTHSKQHSRGKVIYRFFGGAALGTLIVIIPISYGSSIDLNLVQIGIASMLVISCGLLSSIWGEQFLDPVMRLLNSWAP